ncbi:MAG: MarR family transcriptional regulator [Pseudomonadota bacterium]
MPLRLDDQLCFALYAATHAVTRSYRPKLQAVGLTYPQYLVMLALWQDGAQPMGQLAQRLHLAPNAITPLIDRLEVQEFVARAPSESDRRTVVIKLTPRGKRMEKVAAEIQSDVVCETGLSRTRLNALRESLKSLVDDMEVLAVGDASSPAVTSKPRRSRSTTSRKRKRARSSAKSAA